MPLEISTLKKISRIAVFGSSGLLGVVGVLKLFTRGEKIGHYILCIYLMIFAAMSIGAVIPIRLLNKYFSFLNSMMGVGIFLIFSGLIVLLGKNNPLELISALCLLVTGGFNIFVGFRYSDTTFSK